jgi:heptosyltransferase-2
VLLGGPEDAWVKPHFQELVVTDCIGTLSLPEVVSVCDSCDAIVSHDTGPLHLAGLSETPLVGIFGPTDPATRIPRRDFAVGIWGGQGFACRPCYDGVNFAPCQFNGCMRQVTPKMVLRELDQLLTVRMQGAPSPWRIVFPEAVSGTAIHHW